MDSCRNRQAKERFSRLLQDTSSNATVEIGSSDRCECVHVCVCVCKPTIGNFFEWIVSHSQTEQFF